LIALTLRRVLPGLQLVGGREGRIFEVNHLVVVLQIRRVEVHALGRDAVNVRRLKVLLPVAAEIARPEVIGEDEDHIGLAGVDEGREASTPKRRMARDGKRFMVCLKRAQALFLVPVCVEGWSPASTASSQSAAP